MEIVFKMFVSVFSSIYHKIVENIRTLIFWPLFGIAFYAVEQINRNPWKCFEVGCKWDAYIPFCEYFVVAYVMWFIYMAGTIVYLIYKDPKAYEITMRFIILSFSATIVIYFLFPTMQMMRPYDVDRENVFMDVVRWFYRHDTPTNVCPSLHVIGTLATMYGALSSERLMRHRGMKAAYVLVGILICFSTVFLKQHSVEDVIGGVGLCLVVWTLAFRKDAVEIPEEETKKRSEAA
jgi:membrane-associated phospholipid phosphatase